MNEPRFTIPHQPAVAKPLATFTGRPLTEAELRATAGGAAFLKLPFIDGESPSTPVPQLTRATGRP